MDFKRQIVAKARDLGLDLVGFAQAQPLDQITKHLEKRIREKRYTSLEAEQIAERVTPELLLPGVKTVITAGLAYYTQEPCRGPGLRGTLSRSAWGLDYHGVLGNKLKELAAFIENQTGAQVLTFVDTGPPVDRAWAIESGLGWSGKNCALVNPEYGSWVFLGEIFTDLLLEPDKALADKCGDCVLCLKACPTGALGEANVLDPFRCVSYLTQMKGFVPREYRKAMGIKIYGCDSCQAVCPVNKQAKITNTPEFSPDAEVIFPSLLELLSMTNRQFKERFGSSAAAWRGRTVLQRNALIALGNLRCKESKSALINSLHDDRAVIRGHAAWALGQIGEDLSELQAALDKEQDDMVRKELRAAIELCQGGVV